MSGALRRGSLNFDCSLNGKNSRRGSTDSNLYGGFRDTQTRTPEISVIALDFRRYSDDLKKAQNQQQSVNDNVTTMSPNTGEQDPDSDEITTLIGHFGKWQLIWSLALCLFQIPGTFHMFCFVFQTAAKDFWCETSVDDKNGTWQNLTNSCTVPISSVFGDGDNNQTECTNFIFEDDGSGSKTLIEEYQLICDRAYLLTIAEMCFLAGAAVGSVSSGWISDRYGRKHTLLSFTLVQATFGTILAFSSSLAMYMALRVIIGFASMTLAVVSFVLVVELVSGKWRTIIGILNILPMAVSYVLTAGIAYLIRDWRVLQLVISLPWLALLFIWYCVPESPRWLLATGRLNELYKIVERAARFNGLQLPANYQKTLEAVVSAPAPHNASVEDSNLSVEQQRNTAVVTNLENSEYPVECKAATNPLVVVFNRTYWRVTCLNLIIWLTLVMLYFGLTLHLSNLGGNVYINTAIVGSAEAISIIISIFIVLKVGLRLSLIAFMLIPGVCCLATNLVPEGDNNVFIVIALAMIAKCVIGANNAIIPTYTAGHYPTEVRNFGVGMGNLAAGIALILVPYVWLLEHITPLLPLTVLGVCGLIGAAALCLMKDDDSKK